MHISEGILSPQILIGGAAWTVVGISAALNKMKPEDIPKIGILSASFFVASLIHIPIGPASAHLILNGLVGLILGFNAFLAILVGLTLQAVLFQYGGFTGLGVNTLNMALPAVFCFYLFGWGLHSNRTLVVVITAFGCGSVSVLLSGVMVGFCLYLTGEAFLPAAKLIVVSHIPVMLIEGGLTAACVLFLKKVRPELLMPVIPILLWLTASLPVTALNLTVWVGGTPL